MYIATVPNRNSPPAILLRESYRENGKVLTRTIANLTRWKPIRIEALRRALSGELDGVGENSVSDPVSGEIFGVVFALKQLIDQIGIDRALGKSVESQRVMFMIMARIAHGGSRLSAVRWAQDHAVQDVLSMGTFDEDALYDALDWLALQQEKIEQALYRDYIQRVGKPPAIVLYDVTSSYFEGEKNELATFGYNRDKKNGKKQIVIGLLAADDGEPLAVRVFEGNTADPSTVYDQINLMKSQFDIEEVVLVGDRGMIKTKGKQAINHEGWKYITALTNAQTRTLLTQGVLQADLFDQALCEVEHGGKRLVLRCNEAKRQREQRRRRDKLNTLQHKIDQRNHAVKDSPRAQPEVGLKQLQAWCKRHKLSAAVTLLLEGRLLRYELDEAALEEQAKLDGCYVLETDVPSSVMDKTTIDARYRDLQNVERNFRTMKTGLLEVRPIYLRNGARTHAHVFIAMLALKVARVFETRLRRHFGRTDTDENAMTVSDALQTLSRIIFLNYQTKDHVISRLTALDEKQIAILNALQITLPKKTAKLL
jgi:transposase